MIDPKMTRVERQLTIENTIENRAEVALSMMQEIAETPNMLPDPAAVVRMLQWVIDGRVRTMPREVSAERNRRISESLRSGQSFTITAPGVENRDAAPPTQAAPWDGHEPSTGQATGARGNDE